MKRFMPYPLAVATLAASGIVLPTFAQPVLEEVIVTAQKRTENVLDVPSISRAALDLIS